MSPWPQRKIPVTIGIILGMGHSIDPQLVEPYTRSEGTTTIRTSLAKLKTEYTLQLITGYF